MITIEELYKHFLVSNGITTDSRKSGNNKIFFALKGEKFNGNFFAENAINNGCRLAVVDDPSCAKGEHYVLVDDSLSYLQKLANFHRKQLKIPVLALTGSNGKTTTKELISTVLSKKFKVLSTTGNLNNHIGVPMTILNIDRHEIAIIEMGASHAGEIKELCKIAEPDYGLITNIGKAHLEGFGSFPAVKKAKGEMYEYMKKKQGIIFVNYSNTVLKEMASELIIQKIIYGEDINSVCKGKIISEDMLLSPSIEWNLGKINGTASFHTKLTGNYNLENILAAFAVGLYFGIDPDKIINAISGYIPISNRSQLLTTSLQNTLILDAYNANPSSMQNAVMHFASQKHENKVAILGDMLELGKYSGREHEAVLSLLKKLKQKKVFLVGNEFKKADKNDTYLKFQNTHELANYLKHNILNNSLILIKGSRGMQLEQIVEFL